MLTIYVDVLIVLNIYVNYFLIRASAKITHVPLKNIRCIAASVYGSLFSLLILAPQIGSFFSAAIKMASAMTIVLAAFGFQGRRQFTINTLTFFAVNIIFGGAVYAVYTWLKPDFVHFNNTYFYVDFSLIILVITTAAMYFTVSTIRFFLDRTPDDADCYRVIIRYKDKIVSLDALADTGNSLVDFFTGSPVIICEKERLTEITGVSTTFENSLNIPKGFRFIPCSTISENSVIPVFRPDEVIILNVRNGFRKSVEAMVGFSSNSSGAIFNPKLIKI